MASEVVFSLAEAAAREGRALVEAGREDAALVAFEAAADLLAIADEVARW